MDFPARVLDAVIGHCRREYPNEACGVLAGPVDAAGPRDWWPMRNVAEHGRYRYTMDEVEQLHVWKAIDAIGHRVFAIYHSHTDADDYAEPSPEDLRHALDPGILHLIVAPFSILRDDHRIRLWKVVDGSGIEQPYTVVST